MRVYVFVAGFLLGILIEEFFSIQLFLLLFVGTLGFCIAYFGIWYRVASTVFVGLFIIGVSLGGVRVFSSNSFTYSLAADIGKEVSLVGKVAEEIDVRETHKRIVLAQGHERVLVTTERFAPVSFGDRIEVQGVLEYPEPFLTDTGRMFQYDKFLAKDNILYRISFADVEVLSAEEISFRGVLFSVKQFFLRNISAALPEPQSSLAGGITVGARRSLGEELLHAFQITGLIHIVVLSGYNVTIIAESIMRFLSFLPKRIAISIGAGAIAAFVFMVGAGATIVRAGIMAILALIARATGRTYALTRALVIAGFLMLFLNPSIFLYDPSFQLSFIATLGLIHIAPKIQEKLSFVPETFGLREIVAATIGTQIAVLPLLLYLTGLISTSSLIVNLLVLPIIPAAMFFTLVVGIVGSIPVLGILMGLPAYITLSYVLSLVDFVSKLPGAAFALNGFPLWLTFLLYLVLILFLEKERIMRVFQQHSN